VTSVDTLIPEVLKAFRERMQFQLGLKSQTCFISDNPDAKPPTPGASFHPIWCVISDGGRGSFDAGMYDGGAEFQATCMSTIVVTIHTASQMDQPHHADQILNRRGSGLYRLATKALKAFTGDDRDILNELGEQILNQPPFPQDWNVIRDARQHASIQIGFSIVFDWNLIGDED